MSDEQPLFIGIPDPLDLRKDILNSSKVLIGTLKRYESYNELKKTKQEYYGELTRVVKELNMLNRRLKQLMPKAKLKPGMIKQPPRPIKPIVNEMAIRTEFENTHVKRKEIAPREAHSSSIIRGKSILAQLEDELAQVEQKLNKLE